MTATTSPTIEDSVDLATKHLVHGNATAALTVMARAVANTEDATVLLNANRTCLIFAQGDCYLFAASVNAHTLQLVTEHVDVERIQTID